MNAPDFSIFKLELFIILRGLLFGTCETKSHRNTVLSISGKLIILAEVKCFFYSNLSDIDTRSMEANKQT